MSTTQEQANSILNNVLGINSDLYSVQVNSQENTENNGLLQSEVDYRLTSDQGSVRVSASFINNSLNLLYLTEYSGDLAASESASNTDEMAMAFLENYQTFTGDSFYGTLAQTLTDVTGDVSTTKSVGNMTLKVQNAAQATVDYVWTYTDADGISAQTKNVILSYYNGQLNCFLDNWNLYNVVGSPKISCEQAIEIALASVQDYSYQVSDETGASIVSVSGFNVAPESLEAATLSYVNCPDASLARDGNSYNLYSSWWIPIGFDAFYPGDVTGIAVTVWADTGEVSSTELMYADSSFADAYANSVQSTVSTIDEVEVTEGSMALMPLIVIIALVCTGFLLISKAELIRLSGFKKMLVMVFCSMLMLSAMASVVNANAVFPNSSARIYGALDGGGLSPPQSDYEKNATYWVQSLINGYFATSGYTVYDNAGSLTTKQNILGNASSDAATYDRCTVFHYGHMAGYGAGYVDNTGVAVTVSDINSSVTDNKYSFVLLWVCCQAENSSLQADITDICDAWMNDGITGSVQNITDGYNYPDGSGQCFISFYGFSPWIGNDTQTFEQQWTYAMKYFIGYFYYAALVDGYSVRDSLNQASIAFFGTTYTSSILYTGYDLWWPGNPSIDPEEIDEENGQIRSLGLSGWYPRQFYNSGSIYATKNTMQVLGDSSIYLFQPKLTLSANYGLSPTFYFDGSAHGTGDVNVWHGDHYSVGVSVPAGYSFDHISYDGGIYTGNPSGMYIYDSGSMTAYYTQNPTYYTLTVYSGTGGSTSPSAGSYQYLSGSQPQVSASPSGGYQFSYWLKDGVNVGSSNPITVTMNSNHNLQPVFSAIQYSPSTPSVGGPSSGYVSQSYQFSAVSTDANGDNIRYTFNWGDGTSTTTGYYSSGSTAYASHTWTSTGQYSVTVTAQDSTGRSSGSSSPHTITVQNQQTYYLLTVTASDAYNNNLEPPVYIDGGYVGLAGNTFQVTAGAHTVAVHSPFIYWTFDQFSDGLANGATRQITGNTNLHAWYTL